MRAICKVCSSKDNCSYIKRNRVGDCIDVQTSDYGYKEAVEKACEWLKSCSKKASDGRGYIARVVNDKTIDDFRKAMED